MSLLRPGVIKQHKPTNQSMKTAHGQLTADTKPTCQQIPPLMTQFGAAGQHLMHLRNKISLKHLTVVTRKKSNKFEV